MTSVAFATCEDLPDLEPGDAEVAAALRSSGVAVRASVWSDPGVDWSSFRAVVIRSCWDYHVRTVRFRVWLNRLEEAEVAVWNPLPVIRWNLDKAYLQDLEHAGVPIVPTHFVEPGDDWDLADILRAREWSEAVIKPAVSLSAHRTWRCRPDNATEIQRQFETSGSAFGVLVQPYLEQIESDGEWSLVYFASRYSHAQRKLPAPGDFRVQNEHGGSRAPVEPSPAMRSQADAVVAAVSDPCLFARVDGVRIDGVLHVMELEVIDPELYVDGDPAAVERFAAAVRSLL